MKRLIIVLVLSTIMSTTSSITAIFAQNSGSEIQFYQGSDLDGNSRSIVKILSNFDYGVNDTFHMGIVFEKFELGPHDAWGWFVQTGYSFGDFKIPLEITPIASIGQMRYEGAHPFRVQIGLDVGYTLLDRVKAHLSITRARENYSINDGQTWESPYVHVISIGLSYDIGG